jgi:hypothetical protein
MYALLAAIAWGSSTAFSRFTLLSHSNTFITGLRFLLTVPPHIHLCRPQTPHRYCTRR